MATLILAIETVGEQWDGLDDQTRAELLRWIERSARNQAERIVLRQEVVEGLGFSPFTGRIASLCVYDRERAEGVVYFDTQEARPDVREGVLTYKARSEAALLTDFWDGVRQYDTVVTFGGRTFALPFLLHRSVACGVVPTVDLLRKRYLTQQTPPYHIDLQDELSFYSALARRPSLQMVCRAYGITYAGGEVAAENIATMVQAGKLEAVAAQNARDLMATAAVYEKWLQYLAPRDFIQNIDFYYNL
jgi:DNA polymerase elongation subunit (family B)